MNAPRERSGLIALGARIEAFHGWRRAFLALALGVAATAALPPVHFLPFLFVAFSGLLWLLGGGRSAGAAFVLGWWFGFGHFLSGLYWIGAALLTEPERYGWMVAPVVLGLSAGLAVFPAAASLVTWASGARGAARVVALAVSWTAAEWLRGHLLTGFPWNLIGSAWAVSDAMLQVSALTGAYGLSLLTVAAAALPALLAEPPARRSASWRRLSPLAASLALLGLVWAGGLMRLAGAEPAPAPGVHLRIVQGNIPQTEKWRRELGEAHLARYLRLTRTEGYELASHVVWPETAVPFILASDPVHREAVGRAAPPGGLVLTGSVRVSAAADGSREFWNSLQAIDGEGEIVGHYDKFHLVPFGEYVPFRNVLKVTKITEGRGDFARGPGPRTLELPGLPPVSPLICYEAIFPGEVAERTRRPQWLLNLTNDAWFGTTSGPYQHFASARLRAVEEGVPLVRAANTGISAVVDPYGRVTARLGLNRTGVIDAPLPRALAARPLYTRIGDGLLFLLLGLGAGMVMVARVKRS